jgi:Asp-tRNA(Asn)/Glu-tRNA(Gln) amidotransferase A subunit family amidase
MPGWDGAERDHLDPLLALPIARLVAAVQRGEVSQTEVTEAALRRIEAHAAGHAFITTCAERALRRAARPPSGPLAGVPLAVKDLFDTAGIRTTYGSSVFAAHVPTRTAHVVRALERAGAILVGKTNLHEFAFGVTSQNPHWGTVANPAHPGRVAGGSSGGNAAALADWQCGIALGTDTGGSLRIPAACCDVVGYKPADGRLSTHAVFPLAPAFDTVGPMARTVEELALVQGVLTGRPVPVPVLAGLRVGVLAPTGHEDDLADLGARLQPVELPEPSADLMAVFSAEAAITHLRWFPRLREQYGPDLQVKLDAAQRVPAVDYARGLAALRELRERARTEPAVDLVISPTLAIEPPPDNCWEPDVRGPLTRYTRPFNFLGWAAIAVGNLQIAGRDEATVLGFALAWEAAHPLAPGAGLSGGCGTAAAQRVRR